MTEQERNEILASVKAQMTGDQLTDMKLLDGEVRKYHDKDSKLSEALLEMAQGLLPPEQQNYLKSMLYIGNRPLNRIYAEAAALMKQKQFEKSLVLTRQLYEHILMRFRESADSRYFSFRNLLESNLYYQLYHPTKNLIKTPFDFTLFITAHAYNLIELHRPEEAVSVLSEAIRYNPVNPDPRFELAETYKVLNQPDKLLETIRDTLPICTTNYALARCCTNMGYYCVEIKEFDDAVCFYDESMRYEVHPMVAGELRQIGQLTGKRITQPTKEAVRAAFEKYALPYGPGTEMFHVLTSLAIQSQEKQNWEEAVYYLRLIRDLTHDPKAEADLKHAEEALENAAKA